MCSFVPQTNSVVTIGLIFFINGHISIPNIKNNQYFVFLVWIIFPNIFINNIIHIIGAFSETFRMMKMS